MGCTGDLARRVEEAVQVVLQEGGRTSDIGGGKRFSTSEMTEAVLERL
ncbi:MAG: hypothetical protein HYW02_01485 [Deltaproteobacteria bacterium]|nr:hypothetical protein [Deltaproteobacteria bacterium]